jgi:hypothetical protein
MQLSPKKITGTKATKHLVCSAKVLDFFLWHPILVLVVGILSFAGRVLPLFLYSFGGRQFEFLFLFFFF